MLVNQGVETPVPEKVRGGGVRHRMIFIKAGGGGGGGTLKYSRACWNYGGHHVSYFEKSVFFRNIQAEY